MTAVIECDHLTKRYGKARGIEDLTLTVEAGEVFGFLGPNGAGKTTTIRTLLDLHRPTSGRARLFGLDSRARSREIRARTGNLTGDFALDRRVTGERAVALAAAVRGITDVGRAGELAERFHADLARPLGELSRGNRQKVGLVLALFHRPELLILDEPTSGLDPLMQAEFSALVREEAARGATVLLSSHELAEVQQVCDRVAIIRDGRLVATEHVEAMRQRAYRKVTVHFAAGVAAAQGAAGDTGAGGNADRDARTAAAVVDTARFGGLPGVEAVEVGHGRGVDEVPDGAAAGAAHGGAILTFRVRGSVDPVIKALAAYDVLDLEVTRPSLDELFLDYYRRPVAS